MDISAVFLTEMQIEDGYRVEEGDEDTLQLKRDGKLIANFTHYATRPHVQYAIGHAPKPIS